MKITDIELRRILHEELYRGAVINLGSPNGHRTFRGDPRLFERSYVTGVLGIPLNLQESYPYSAAIERQIIREQMLYENWWGDDWHLFEKAYGHLLETYSTQELLDLLQEGPLDWAGDLLKKGYEKGKETVEKGIEAGKEALISAKEGIKKFGEEGWKILSAMWLVMKGGAKDVGLWASSVAKRGVNQNVGQIKDALKFLVAKLPEWKMPTFAKMAQKALDAIEALIENINSLEGWKRVIGFSGLAVGLTWAWQKVGDWIEQLKEKIGDLDPRAQIKEEILGPIKEWIKETAMEKLKEIGGDTFKKVMTTLTSAATGVKPWWDAAVKVVGGAKLVVDSLGKAASRFMSRQGGITVAENVTKGNTMKLTEGQLRRIIREVGGFQSEVFDVVIEFPDGSSEALEAPYWLVKDATSDDEALTAIEDYIDDVDPAATPLPTGSWQFSQETLDAVRWMVR